jgi:hypothetical protein
MWEVVIIVLTIIGASISIISTVKGSKPPLFKDDEGNLIYDPGVVKPLDSRPALLKPPGRTILLGTLITAAGSILAVIFL